MTQPIGRMVLRIFSVVILAVLAVNAARFVGSETARQEVQAMMASIQTRQTDNFDALNLAARALSSVEPFQGAFADVQADALSTIAFLSSDSIAGDGSNSLDKDIRTLYKTALEIKPRDGYLWARYAVFLDHQFGSEQRDEILHALKQAFRIGARDYNTIRLVGKLGIKRWPWLNCDDRSRLVGVLEYAETVDDLILARWNSDLRLSRLQADLEQQYERYGFNLQWARLYVNRCGAG